MTGRPRVTSSIGERARWAVGAILLAAALGIGILGVAAASRGAGAHDESQQRRAYGREYGEPGGGYLPMVFHRGVPMDPAHQEECGACHVAYPPNLLPSRSWKAIMTGLDDHFGENADLPTDTNARIAELLDKSASDRGDRLRNTRLLHSVAQAAPVRITGLPYFRRIHGEIPRSMVEDSPLVQTFSRRDACHRDAAKGSFDEDTVAIPGFRRGDG